MKIKHILLAVVAVLSVFSVSCVSTGKVEYNSNGDKVIYGSKSLKDTFEKFGLITDLKTSEDYPSVPYLIGKEIEDCNAKSAGQKVASLPDGLKKSSTILILDSDNTLITYYEFNSQTKTYTKYVYQLFMNWDDVGKYAVLTNAFTSYKNESEIWEKKEVDASMPVLTKTRSVPYTEYRTEVRSSYVGGQYNSYTVTVPYTVYRTETYTVPNPNYSLEKAAEYKANKEKCIKQINKTLAEISNLELFRLDSLIEDDSSTK